MRSRVAALSLLVLTAAACSSGSSGGGGSTPGQTSPPPASSSASASASPTESPSESPSPTPSFTSTVHASHRCLTSALSLSLGQAQGAAGSTIVPIVLKNASDEACTLFGRPGVSFLDANGNQLGVGATFGGDGPATVTLAPGESANALLKIPDPGNFSPADCTPANSSRLRVYPPGDKVALTADYVASVCTSAQGAAQVSPVTPGEGG